MNRRSFISSPVKSLFLLAVATLPYGLGRFFTSSSAPTSLSINHDKLRPPGASLSDIEFKKACINCTLCADVCPPVCIKYYPADNADNAGTPYIEPADTGCTLCGKCMEACPTNALTVTNAKEVQMGKAIIERLACYPWMDTGVCGACVSICPLGEKAISFEFANFYRPVVNDGCVGCGLCVEVCPHPSLPIRVVGNVVADGGRA